MTNISVTTNSNNTSSSSSAMDFPSKAEGIALCSAFALEAVFIVVGNLLTIFFFVFNSKLRKKSLFLVINMTFADAMLGAVTLPLYVFLLVGPSYQLWTYEGHSSLDIFFNFFDTTCSQASLISAVLISCERFYAIYWPLKHRTLSKQAYRIVIIMVWTLAILVAGVYTLIRYFISIKHAIYAWMSFPLISLFIICGCNIGIWRKFQHGNMGSQQHNRASQNQRLTKTLLFVSAIAVLSWLPLIVATSFWVHVFIPRCILCYAIVNAINYFNSFLNPVVYALRIPEFRQALGLCCLRREAEMNKEGNKRRANKAVALTLVPQLRTLQTDLSHLQLAFEQDVMDTKL